MTGDVMGYLGFTGKDYFKRSWTMLTRQKGWLKAVLILFCVGLIPIVGTIWDLGYAMEWSRLTAWGVDSSPKQKDIRIGECFSSGWCAFIVEFCYDLVFIVCAVALTWIFRSSGAGVGSLVSLVILVAAAFYVPLTHIAALRAVLYRKASAGLSVGRVWEMVSLDKKGFRRLGWMQIAWNAVVSLLLLLCSVPFLVMYIDKFMAVYYVYYLTDPFSLVLMMFGYMLPFLVFDLLVHWFSAVMLLLVTCNACGLWMMQFDVPHWGRASDPLPRSTVPGAAAGALPPTW
jgi:hypothetical protein